MAKRNRSANQRATKKRIAENRGAGRLGDYTPWLKIQDVADGGNVTRIKGLKTGRIHHLLSQWELKYFYLLDWATNIVDIREQYPLDQDETIAIAEEAGFRHPCDPVSKEHSVVVSTFLITVKQGIGTKEIARTVVHSKALNNRNIVDKLEIERRYWTFRRIDWGIVTEGEINEILAKNIAWIHSSADSADLGITRDQIRNIEAFLLAALKKECTPLRDITNRCDEKFKLEPGSALSVVRHLIAVRRLPVNMTAALIQPEEPLCLAG